MSKTYMRKTSLKYSSKTKKLSNKWKNIPCARTVKQHNKDVCSL